MLRTKLCQWAMQATITIRRKRREDDGARKLEEHERRVEEYLDSVIEGGQS
ncbi:hypothetical protein IB265_18755 [Ensifer sp. ENS10]|uniref:hypothetical protein n=1 Tax=Ensifer sp. ENS10 TaxID=2769286 RepID=UPI0017862B13|nr:hypothetical protein [Ensifer sp. ENS10]MBD9508826.1 hypothetical protein [Ensifer sp. ENS10]